MLTGTDIHVVLGASGGTGSAVVKALFEGGKRVRAVNRGGSADVPEGVERVAADVSSVDQARRAVEGASVVYHCAQPEYTRWPEDFPLMNRSVIEATASAGAKLVFADNLYMYGPVDGPMDEQTPLRATGRKGRTRIEMADELLSAHRGGRLRVAIGRASDYYGPEGLDSALGDRFFQALLAGKKVQWFGRLDQPHTASYLEDMGRAYVIIGERGEADGQIWHLPAAEPITGQRFCELAIAAAGTPAKPAVLSPSMVKLAGVFSSMVREFNETMYQWTAPFVVDASRFEEVFGPFPVTAHDEALGRTVAWFRSRAVGEAEPLEG